MPTVILLLIRMMFLCVCHRRHNVMKTRQNNNTFEMKDPKYNERGAMTANAVSFCLEPGEKKHTHCNQINSDTCYRCRAAVALAVCLTMQGSTTLSQHIYKIHNFLLLECNIRNSNVYFNKINEHLRLHRFYWLMKYHLFWRKYMGFLQGLLTGGRSTQVLYLS